MAGAENKRSGARKWTYALILLAGFFVAGVSSLSCSSIPETIGLENGRLAPCPDSPNCVNSEFQGEASWIEPLSFEGDASEAFRSLLAFLEDEPRVEVVVHDEGYAHAVFHTPLLRFRDDVEFRLEAGRGVVHVRSASRVGYSDLGANRKRVESIRRRWGAPGSH